MASGTFCDSTGSSRRAEVGQDALHLQYREHSRPWISTAEWASEWPGQRTREDLYLQQFPWWNGWEILQHEHSGETTFVLSDYPPLGSTDILSIVEFPACNCKTCELFRHPHCQLFRECQLDRLLWIRWLCKYQCCQETGTLHLIDVCPLYLPLLLASSFPAERNHTMVSQVS